MFFSELIEVLRSQGGTYEGTGMFKENPRLSFRLPANVQPLGGRELLLLPEGKRDKTSLKIFTDTPLQETDEANGKNPDIVVWMGKQFEVHSVKYYDQILPHYESVAVNVNVNKGVDK